MKFSNIIYWILIAAIITSTACKKDDPVIPNEEELITDLIYSLTPVGGGTTVVLSFQDLDGDGGNPPTITNGALLANTVYEGSIALFNKSVTPAIDITKEVDEEATNHQFFYAAVAGVNISFSYADQDSNGNPIGLATTLTTGDASQGEIVVTLRHEPNKTAAGVSSGSIANAGGETDIEVSFDVTVQ